MCNAQCTMRDAQRTVSNAPRAARIVHSMCNARAKHNVHTTQTSHTMPNAQCTTHHANAGMHRILNNV
eukprot:7499695-Lingulodinium_polyedra.AAC.1